MAARKGTRSFRFTLPEGLGRFLEEQVAEGQFHDASDFLCHLLRRRIEEVSTTVSGPGHRSALREGDLPADDSIQTQLEQQVLAGKRSGPARPLQEVDWRRLRAIAAGEPQPPRRSRG